MTFAAETELGRAPQGNEETGWMVLGWRRRSRLREEQDLLARPISCQAMCVSMPLGACTLAERPERLGPEGLPWAPLSPSLPCFLRPSPRSPTAEGGRSVAACGVSCTFPVLPRGQQAGPAYPRIRRTAQTPLVCTSVPCTSVPCTSVPCNIMQGLPIATTRKSSARAGPSEPAGPPADVRPVPRPFTTSMRVRPGPA